MTDTFILEPGRLSLADLRHCMASTAPIALGQSCRDRVVRGRRAIETIVKDHRAVYGVNTGFGRLAQTRIPDDRLSQLQRNLVLSHAAGTGPRMADDAVRLMLLSKINCLAQGYSGVRPELINAMVAFFNSGLIACIPVQGSCGASGDLAPLAHMTAAMMGIGESKVEGAVRPAAEALAEAGLRPLDLAAKEGLAMLNGTQASTALALTALFRFERVFAAAVVAGAMSVDAALGSDTPFDPRLHALRGQTGQIQIASAYRTLLAGSAIRASHATCDRVQDPYSLRCQPQVMGACHDQMRTAAEILAREVNAVSDNPIVCPDTGDVMSGGNFHGEPVAMAADGLALAIAETGALAERRIALLTDAGFSRLPPFLVDDAGLNSGFMIAQVTAAALASENKLLAHPASVDSLPTSANQEDHVSMSAFAARRLSDMEANTEGIIAIELLAAAQGLEYRRPLRSSDSLEAALASIRGTVPRYEEDRYFASDIEAVRRLVASGAFVQFAEDILPPEGGG